MTLQVVALVGLLLLFALSALVLFTAYTARRVNAALPPLGRFVEVGGSRIHYLEKGSGPTLLFIHGLGASMRVFTHSLVERLSGEAIVESLAALPPVFREVVVLVDIGDFSYADAAEILGIPIGTVMSRLYRGRRLLKGSLAERQEEGAA